MSKDKKRRIVLVIEDIDLERDTFAFTMQGDAERIGLTDPTLVPTAAEQWAMVFFTLCKDNLESGGNVKKLNREERRKG